MKSCGPTEPFAGLSIAGMGSEDVSVSCKFSKSLDPLKDYLSVHEKPRSDRLRPSDNRSV